MSRIPVGVRVVGVVAALGLALGMTAGVASSLTAPQGVVTKVTICHRTNANNNPYVVIEPDVAGVLNGHADIHTGPVWDPTLKAQHIKWGDIIPPFDYGDPSSPSHFDGLNWGKDGQSIYANDCVPTEPLPEQEYGSISVTKVVTGLPLAGTPVGGTVPDSYTVHVSCDDGTEQDVTFPAAGGAGTPEVIDHVEAGSLCLVTEAGTDGFPTGTVVTYDPASAGPGGDGVFVDAEQVVTVTVTNAFTGVEVQPGVVTPPTQVEAAAVAVATNPALTG
jgi:hypothetical protein